MRRDDYVVFSKGNIAGLSVKNRLVRSATYEGAMTKEGEVTPQMLTLYGNLAEGGVGTIITGHMAVRREGQGLDRQTCIYDDRFIPEIAPIADTVHRKGNGCKVIAQLTYAGRQVFHENKVAECAGPSDVPSTILKKRAKVLDVDEIKTIADCFADAALRVKKAGFDGVQIHGAHGYLISSFLSPYTNRRDDDYGGSLEKRTAILKEIMGKARERVGDFPILIKMNCDDHIPGGITPESFPEVARTVAAFGVDAIEVSGGMWDCLSRKEEELGFLPIPIPESRTRIASPEKQSYYVPFARNLGLAIPVIVVGGNRNVETLEKIMQQGDIDFLSMSRPLVCEPDLPKRWLEGEGSEKAFCVSCNSCLTELKVSTLKCVLKQNKIKQKLIKGFTPHLWKMVMK